MGVISVLLHVHQCRAIKFVLAFWGEEALPWPCQRQGCWFHKNSVKVVLEWAAVYSHQNSEDSPIAGGSFRRILVHLQPGPPGGGRVHPHEAAQVSWPPQAAAASGFLCRFAVGPAVCALFLEGQCSPCRLGASPSQAP